MSTSKRSRHHAHGGGGRDHDRREGQAQRQQWGVAGYGEGTLTLTPEGSDGESRAAMRTDLDLMMGAVGLRGVLVEAPEGGGPALAAKADAQGVRTTTVKVRGLSAAEADVTRLRLGLEASWAVRFEGGGTLTPSLEVGVRQVGGDAETGFGADIGGGIAWSGPLAGGYARVVSAIRAEHAVRGCGSLTIAWTCRTGGAGWGPSAPASGCRFGEQAAVGALRLAACGRCSPTVCAGRRTPEDGHRVRRRGPRACRSGSGVRGGLSGTARGGEGRRFQSHALWRMSFRMRPSRPVVGAEVGCAGARGGARHAAGFATLARDARECAAWVARRA